MAIGIKGPLRTKATCEQKLRLSLKKHCFGALGVGV